MRGSRRRRSIYRREYEKPTDANILRLLTPSILGMLLCMVCLAGMTWAWFTSTSDAAVTTIQAAKFEVDVSFNDDEVTKTDGHYTIEPEKMYKVTLKAPEELKNKVYCKIDIEEGSYRTQGIDHGDSFTFTVCSEGNFVKISSGWMSFDGTEIKEENEQTPHIGKGLSSDAETTEDKNGEQPPVQTDKDNQAEAKVEPPETSDSSNNSQTSISENNSGSKSDTKDSDSNSNADKPADSGNSDTSGNSGDSVGPDNANFAENDKSDTADTGASANTGTGSSNTADTDTGNAGGDNTETN